MKPEIFKKSNSGKCIRTLEGYWAFIPNPLPPSVTFDEEMTLLLSKADRLMGELKGTGHTLPNPYLLITPYTQREAVSSSQIEGTQASLNDLLLLEAGGTGQNNLADIQEVQNYARALEVGVKRMGKLPISTRFLKELHSILMRGVRGHHTTPGELRVTQNWIGSPGCLLPDAKHVPPPVKEMAACLSDLEQYIHSDPKEPLLIQCAFIHYQFEAIHPFLDGNGRLGRLLILFLMLERGMLSQPILYLSSFFYRYRTEYYTRLFEVSQKGAWNEWIKFFLRGVCEQSQAAITDAKHLTHLQEEIFEKVRKQKNVPETVTKIIEELFQNPIISVSHLSKKWKLPYNSVNHGVKRLVKMKILTEKTGGLRNKIYVCPQLLELIGGGSSG